MHEIGLLNDMQREFLSGRSTCTNLLEAANDWTNNLKHGYATTIAFIDFKRAFDSICFSKLLVKLSAYGVKGKLFDIISSFLNGRRQSVC